MYNLIVNKLTTIDKNSESFSTLRFFDTSTMVEISLFSMFIVQENVVTQISVRQLVKTQTNFIQQKNIKNLKSQTLFHTVHWGKSITH